MLTGNAVEVARGVSEIVPASVLILSNDLTKLIAGYVASLEETDTAQSTN